MGRETLRQGHGDVCQRRPDPPPVHGPWTAGIYLSGRDVSYGNNGQGREDSYLYRPQRQEDLSGALRYCPAHGKRDEGPAEGGRGGRRSAEYSRPNRAKVSTGVPRSLSKRPSFPLFGFGSHPVPGNEEGQKRLKLAARPMWGYSSANTLIMNRLEFSCEQLSKCLDVIGQPGRHGGGTLPPPGLKHAFTYPLLQRDRGSQTHVGSGKVIEGLKKDDAPSHLRACLTQGAALTDQGRQGVAEGLIEAFDQAGADVHAQACQFLSAQHDPLVQDA